MSTLLPGYRHGFDRATPHTPRPANPWEPVPFELPDDLDAAHDEIRRLAAELQQTNIGAANLGTSLRELERVRDAERSAANEQMDDLQRDKNQLRLEVDKLTAKVAGLLYLLDIQPEPDEPGPEFADRLPIRTTVHVNPCDWCSFSAAAKKGAAA